MTQNPIESILVVGGGSAGLIAALTLRVGLPRAKITLVRSRELGVIGVGEGTTTYVPSHLHGYLGLDPGEFYRDTLPSWKLGIRFYWGPRPYFDYTFGHQLDWRWHALPKLNGFYCEHDFTCADQLSALMSADRAFIRQANGEPLIDASAGYHVENARFIAYLERKAAEREILLRDAKVSHATEGEQGIGSIVLDGEEELTADLYVDSTGFRSLLLGKTLREPFVDFSSTLFCNRAVIGEWPRTTEPTQTYTTADTMTSGWRWQIEHPEKIVSGYVYSAAFCSDEAAEAELRARTPKVGDTFRVQFPSGRYERSWVKNVMAIGNAAGFVEPLEATSLHTMCYESFLLAETLMQCDNRPTPSLQHNFNRMNARVWDQIRAFLGVHYRFNTRLDTPFWRACRESVELGPAQALVDFYQENGPVTIAHDTLLDSQDMFGMEGYLSLLVGMKVPHRKPYLPSPEELEIWNAQREHFRRNAAEGLTVEQAYKHILAPQWKWTPGFYNYAGPPVYNRK